MDYQQNRVHFGFGARLTPVVKALLIANGVVFFLQLVFPGFWEAIFALRPRLVWSRGFVWQLASYMFLHDRLNLWHLLINMFMLWMFGCEVERLFGRRRFIFYYFLTGIGAAITHVIFFHNSMVYVVGASGAIYGVLLAFGLYFPDRKMYVFPFLFMPIRARTLVLIMGGLAFLGSLSSAKGGGVAHLAHLGGMVFGFFYIRKLNWIADIQFLIHRWKQQRLRKKYRVHRGGEQRGPGWYPDDDDDHVH